MSLTALAWTLSLNDIELTHVGRSAEEFEKGFRAFASRFPHANVVTFVPGELAGGS